MVSLRLTEPKLCRDSFGCADQFFFFLLRMSSTTASFTGTPSLAAITARTLFAYKA